MKKNLLINGVMTAQLVLMGGLAYYNVDTIGKKDAEINKLDKVVADFKQVNVKQEKEIKKLNQERSTIDAKLQEEERLRNEQNGVIEKQKASLAEYENTINQLKQENESLKSAKTEKQSTEVSSSKNDGEVIQMVASAYTNHPSENGVYGGKVVTRTGFDITNTITYQGMGIVASDPSVIPLNSIIEIEGLGTYIVLDTGSAINGNKLDVLMGSSAECDSWGVRNVKVTILKRG